MRRFFYSSLLVPIAIGISSSLCFAQDTVAEHYKTLRYDCAIFSATQKNTGLSDEYYPKRFTPSHTQVDFVEKKLRKSTALFDSMCNGRFSNIDRHLRKYKRQYTGYIDTNGHRIIYINCFRLDADYPHEFDDWLQRIVRVSDGGDYYWRTWFDIDTGKFIGLGINGYA